MNIGLFVLPNPHNALSMRKCLNFLGMPQITTNIGPSTHRPQRPARSVPSQELRRQCWHLVSQVQKSPLIVIAGKI